MRAGQVRDSVPFGDALFPVMLAAVHFGETHGRIGEAAPGDARQTGRFGKEYS